ncbi:MAG: AsmA family protein [Nevskiaceae bacterium]|nr:MAG: AsmA family protein [Nevskiaceae bacterium]
MSKPLKIVLAILGGFVALLIVAAIALPLLFDPNHFRAQISATVNDEYHRKLELGDIKLSVFPWLRVRVSQVTLGNAEGFGSEPFAQVGELDVGVKLMPLLFDRQLQASTLSLSGLRLHLQKNAKGVTNWADLTTSKDEDKTPKPQKSEGEGFALKGVNVSGIEISDAALDYSDAQAGKHYSVDHLSLKTGTLKPGQPVDVTLALALDSKAPQAHVELKLGGTLVTDVAAKTYAVKDLKLDADLSGAAVPGGKQKVALRGDARYDQGQGSAQLSKASLQAAGVTLETEISGSGLNGDAPKLSGPIIIKPFKPREALTQLGIKLPETADKAALSDASLKAQYNGDFKSAALSGLTLDLDQTKLSGSLNIRDFATQAIEFALQADQLDVDRYLPPKKAAESGSAGGDPATARTALNATKLPGDALNALNVNGSVEIGTLKASGLQLSNVRLKLSGAKGAPKQQELSAKLYGGQIAATTKVSGKSYGVNAQLQSLNVEPFLKDLTGKDKLSGVGSLKLSVTGNGATVGELRRTLNGDVSLNLQNGAVKGFNLGQMLRDAQATFAGQASSAQSKSTKETDFAAVSASGKIVNGILKSDSLDARSPLLRMSGSGEIDLVNETINYTAKPTVVENSEGQGGKDLSALRGLTIPVQLSGSLYDPQVRLAVGDALKQKATAAIQQQLGSHADEIQQKLKDKLGDNLGGVLGNLLGGKKAETQTPPAQPAPAQPPPAQPTPEQTQPQKPGT